MSRMDTLLEDQNLQAVLGRVDFTGIENAGLDFSQLEDYINDEEDANESIFTHGQTYFTETLVNSDLKLPPESSRVGIKATPINLASTSSGTHRILQGTGNASSLPQTPGSNNGAATILRTPSVTLTVSPVYGNSPTSGNSPVRRQPVQISPGPNINQGVTTNESIVNPLHISQQLNINHHQHHQHQQQPQQQHQQQQQHHQTISLFNKASHPHHLPESPPDSGSEPPYSPSNDENRVNGANQSSVTSIASQQQQQPGEMMQTGSIDNIKQHFVHYPTNHTRHLPSTEITLNPSSNLHSPRSTSIGNHHLDSLHSITGAVQVHPDDAGSSMISHLGASIINGPINLQSPSMMHGLSPSPGTAHLTTLYASNEDYLHPCSGDCGPELSSQQQHHHQKKRKLSESPKNVVTTNSTMINGNLVHIKQEPGGMSPEPGNNNNNGQQQQQILPSMEDDYGFDYNASHEGPPSVYLDSAYQCIRFQAFQQSAWHVLCDVNLKELPAPNYRVDADKGFNFSNADDAFVCQKKNHFQVTVHVQPIGEPQYVKTPDSVKKIDNFYLHFYGVKVESPSQTIKVEQSQSDRSKKPFHPVLIELNPDQVSKTTVGRLHFSETTSNNMRKKGKPNPDQRYFYLVVSLFAHVGDETYQIISHASERIIVRASNPGQFENDMELSWQKGHTPESIYHAGRVGVNTDRPDESLVVHGNLKVTGHIVQPSDRRAKTNIEEVNTREQLKNVSNIRVVRYQFTPEFAKQVGLNEDDINGTGIIAQEVRQIIPDAVKEAGDVVLPTGERIEKFLVVNKERIFMENVGAVKELCKVTDNLETRIDELERMNKKLRRINRFDSIKSILSTSSVASASTVTCMSSYSGGPPGKHFGYKLPHSYENHGRKCSKHNDKDNQVCTNRFMQSIIMILVLIMAFCLASIVTLYILDYPRHQSNQMNPSNPYNIDHKISQQQAHHKPNVNTSTMSSIPFSSSPSSTSFPSSSSSLTSKSVKYPTKGPQARSDTGSYPYSPDDSQEQMEANHQINWSASESDKESNSRPTSIPILKPRVLGQLRPCLESNSKSSSCTIHCCINPSQMIPRNLNHDSDGDSSYSEASGESDKQESVKDIEVESKSKDILKESNLDESRLKESSSAFHLSSLPPQSTPSTVSQLSHQSNPSVISGPLKINAVNNHVSEDVSSRVNHGRFIGSPSSLSSSADDQANHQQHHHHGGESSGHINNLNADNLNYTLPGGLNYTALHDPIDQHINTKVRLSESFVNNNKFVSYNSNNSPGISNSNQANSMIYSKAEEYREKRETRESESRANRQESLPFKSRIMPRSLTGLVDSVKLLELNATIGREFCTTWQCVQQSGPALTYLIPISKYMSYEYVTLQFSLNMPLKVDNCQYKERPTSCPSLPPGSIPHAYHRPMEHLPQEETSPSFRIPIGLYLQSTYAFRVLAKEKNTDTPCSLPESELGSSYLEYKFIFSRICDK